MSIHADALGRQPLTVLEMDLRQNIGGSDQIITYRFCDHDVVPPISLNARPVITRVNKQPSRLAIGSSLGLRDAIAVTCADFVNVNDVAGGPAVPGVLFWHLLKARVPIVTNRPARLISGYVVDGVFVPETTLTLFIDRIDGPSTNNDVTIHLRDALIKADNRKAQAPAVGTAKLLSSINASDTTATLTPVSTADNYAANGFLRLGDSKEILHFTRIADQLTLTRGVLGSTAEAHNADDAIQEIVVFQNETLSEIVYKLLVNYANIDPALIDKIAWDAENAAWLATFSLSALIWDPTGVTTLLQELTSQFPIYLLYDARVPEISFQAIKPASFNLSATLNEREHILRRTLSVKEDPDKRLSQIWFYFAQKDPSESQDDARNYSRLVPFTDPLAEQEHDEKRIRKVFSRWLPVGSDAVVTDIGDRMLARLRNNKRLINFELDAKDADLWTGQTVGLNVEAIVDHNGVPSPVFAQIIESAERVPGSVYRYIAEDLFIAGRFGFYAPDTIPDYPLADPIDRSTYAFYADDNDKVNGGTETGYSYL